MSKYLNFIWHAKWTSQQGLEHTSYRLHTTGNIPWQLKWLLLRWKLADFGYNPKLYLPFWLQCKEDHDSNVNWSNVYLFATNVNQTYIYLSDYLFDSKVNQTYVYLCDSNVNRTYVYLFDSIVNQTYVSLFDSNEIWTYVYLFDLILNQTYIYLFASNGN